MIKVNEFQYHIVLPLMREYSNTCPTFAYSVIEGIIPGSVFVDNEDLPKTILVGTKNGLYFVAGDESNDRFNEMFLDFYKQSTNEKVARFTLFSATRSWDRVIRNLLKETVQMNRYKYSWNTSNLPMITPSLPKGYGIEEISEKTIKVTSNFTKDYYDEYWDGVSNFLRQGFGFCVLYKGNVVSECTSIFSTQSCVEVDIATLSEYTGNGFAYILAKVFIIKSIEKGLTVSWDCDSQNSGSIKLASKVGFDNPVEYSIFVRRKG